MSDYQCNLRIIDSVDWQRSNASNFIQWLNKEQEWYNSNHCEFWDVWLEEIFDLRTCDDFGLSVWSIILNEPTYGVNEASPPDYPAWGFGENRKSFNNGNFGTNSDSGYNFTTEERRILLQLKAYILHMSGRVHGEGVLGINEALQRIFGEGKIVCIDNRDMSFNYVIFDSTLSGLAIELYNRDLLPRPACIGIKAVIDGGAVSWGFGENRSNFNNGNFYNGIIIGD